MSSTITLYLFQSLFIVYCPGESVCCIPSPGPVCLLSDHSRKCLRLPPPRGPATATSLLSVSCVDYSSPLRNYHKNLRTTHPATVVLLLQIAAATLPLQVRDYVKKVVKSQSSSQKEHVHQGWIFSSKVQLSSQGQRYN